MAHNYYVAMHYSLFHVINHLYAFIIQLSTFCHPTNSFTNNVHTKIFMQINKYALSQNKQNPFFILGKKYVIVMENIFCCHGNTFYLTTLDSIILIYRIIYCFYPYFPLIYVIMTHGIMLLKEKVCNIFLVVMVLSFYVPIFGCKNIALNLLLVVMEIIVWNELEKC